MNAPVFLPDVPFAISEEPRQYLLCVDLLGWGREHVGIQVSDGTLEISGARHLPASAWPTRSPHGCVTKVVLLPHDVDPCSVVADFRDGILRVRLPRMTRRRSFWPS